MNNENIEDLIPPIPQEALNKQDPEIIHTTKKVVVIGADNSFNDFLSNWKPPSEGKITKIPSLILVNKIEWQVVAEFKNQEELNHFFTLRPELVEKTVIIEKRSSDEYFHEDSFTLRKFKSIIKESPLLQKPMNGEIAIDVLAEFLSSALSPKKP